ncbi:three-helix bundle dimerization domain-containing protein [Microbacterium sp. cx-59]|uniref:three-helix bundle dimerization domain-containing protein n=1 Tax=Microbacterium sp. cx-59 TaxID=2891207 RepID=UPI001E3E695F|nr:hypothetical protein [Microbacterium sp. cx-59]MCC4906735.1 hypothetical protein [Microbacterium sp. cx-59]
MTSIPFPLAGGTSDSPIVDGWLLTSYAGVVQRLAARFPHIRTVDIEAVLVREHEAFTGGRPVAIPIDVESGAEEILAAGADPGR